MRSDEALGRLDEMIAAASVDRESPTVDDLQRVWDVLREFAREPVDDADAIEDDGDMFLAQYGISPAWKEEPAHFYLDITRQFSFSLDGEYDHMAQLNCTFSLVPTPENRALRDATLWGAPNDEFFDRALSLPGFQLIEQPIRFETDYSDV